MRKILFLFMLGILSTASALAQSITGVLYSTEDNTVIEGAHLLNMNRNQMAVSSAKGFFILEAQQGDTLVISNINYKTKQLIVSEARNFEVWLNPASIQLKEVVVSNLPESEADFRKNLIDMPMQGDGKFLPLGMKPAKPMGKIPVYYNSNNYNTVGYAIKRPISFIQKKLSKKFKAKQKYYETVAAQGSTILSHKKYNRDVVEALTGLKDKQLTAFMEHLDLDNAFINRTSEYELAVLLLRELTLFQELQEH